MNKVLTRRDFMIGGAFALFGLTIGFSQPEAKKTRVVLVRHELAVDDRGGFNQDIIQQMLDQAVSTLFNENDPLRAYKRVVKADDVVGVKTNVWAYLPTPPQLEKAIEGRLLEVGVNKENISFDDRNVRNNPIFQRATALINVRPLRTHYLAGMSGCLKNYVTFAQNIPDYHPQNCAKLALLFQLPMVKGKTRLNILAALTPQFHGQGPHHFNRRYVWNYKGLIVGLDPVAVDTVGLEIIKAKRVQQFGPSRQMPGVPRYIKLADVKYKLGTSDLNKIDLVKLGWKKDILI